MTKQCQNCGTTFNTDRLVVNARKQKYCSAPCRQQYLGLRSAYRMSPGSVGALSELMASVDLMKQGFEVYRALSPSSSCDVLGLRDGKMYRFEVRTGYRSRVSDKVSHATNGIRADYVAVVLHKPDEILYKPPLPPQTESYVPQTKVS